MRYEMVTVSVRPGKAPEALRHAGEALGEHKGPGALLGFWSTEIGPLNRLIALWSHPDAGAYQPVSPDAAWIRPSTELVTDVQSEEFRLFPFVPDIKPGKYGPIYELRSYQLVFGRLPATIERWRGKIDERVKISRLTAAMHSVGGSLCKFVHIWPYESLDQRQKLRAQATAMGVWPPPGGADSLAVQENAILMPAPFSPLQ